MENYYLFKSKLVSSTVQVHEDVLNNDKKNGLVRGDFSGLSFPIVFRKESGKKFLDLLDTGWAGLYLISDRLKNVFQENCITGWKTFAVRVIDKQGQEITGYNGLSIIGRCGSIDYRKSEVVERKFVPNGAPVKYYKGLHIDLSKWDRTGIFLVENSLWIIVTKSSADAMKEIKLTNVELINIAEIEIDCSIVNSGLHKTE